MKLIILAALLGLVYGDVSHILLEHRSGPELVHVIDTTTTTVPPPPRPYAFGYSAGRYPGHVDRVHSEVSDGSGVVKGSYSYVDPRHQIRTVDYIADAHGFHPVVSGPGAHQRLPNDSPVVAAAKQKHLEQYAAIAHAHQTPVVALPRESAAVVRGNKKHHALFQRITEEHAQIAAEQEALRAANAEAAGENVLHVEEIH